MPRKIIRRVCRQPRQAPRAYSLEQKSGKNVALDQRRVSAFRENTDLVLANHGNPRGGACPGLLLPVTPCKEVLGVEPARLCPCRLPKPSLTGKAPLPEPGGAPCGVFPHSCPPSSRASLPGTRVGGGCSHTALCLPWRRAVLSWLAWGGGSHLVTGVGRD